MKRLGSHDQLVPHTVPAVWFKIINFFISKEINNFEYCNIYNDDGDIIDKEDIKDEIKNFWNPIYRQHENEIIIKWNNTAMKKYKNSFNSNNKSTGKYISKINIDNWKF